MVASIIITLLITAPICLAWANGIEEAKQENAWLKEEN